MSLSTGRVDGALVPFAAVLDRAEGSAVQDVQQTVEQFAAFKERVERLFRALASENESLRGQLDRSVAEEKGMGEAFKREIDAAALQEEQSFSARIDALEKRTDRAEALAEREKEAFKKNEEAVQQVKSAFAERVASLEDELAEAKRSLAREGEEAARQGEVDRAETEQALRAATQAADAKVEALKRENEEWDMRLSSVWRPPPSNPGCSVQ